MKIIYNKIVLLLSISSVVLFGCEKQLLVKPAQSINAATALDSREEINASLTSMYAFLKGPRLFGRDIIAIPDALADNGYATNKSGRLLAESNNQFGAQMTGTVWATSYAAINQINLTLEAIPALNIIPAATAAEKASWEGQLYFLRGLYYFELMKAYAYTPGAVVAAQNKGGVVISLTGFKTVAGAQTFLPTRQSIDSCYKVIINDFKNAESRLSVSASERNIATKGAAQALLSKVYLYANDMANAKLWADNTITSLGIARLSDQSDYVAQWRAADNKETIFQVKYNTTAENIGVNESLQTSYTTLITPGLTSLTGGFGDLVPSISLLNAVGLTLVGGNVSANFTGANAAVATRTSDIRNLMYEPGTTGRGKSYVECTKFLGKNGATNLDNVPVIRMSEIYLTRAEAFANPSSPVFNAASALADLKVIKSRRYVGYAGSAIETSDNGLTPADLYEEVLNQRRIELAFEGHRFHDFKRLGRNIVKSTPSTASVLFTDARFLAPILQADVDGNPNLKQNFGY